MHDASELLRFVDAQDARGTGPPTTYDTALAELRAGAKRTHWMWFVLPQLRGLGRSPTAQHYGLDGLDESRAYLDHPVLGPRLRACCEALLAQPVDAAEAVLGPVDALKLRSSMTLFDAVAPDDVFADVLQRFFAGERDAATLRLLG